jgi:hypothetical protein
VNLSSLVNRDGFSAPVTGTPEVAAPVGALVGALVDVDSTVTGGTFVAGTVVLVVCPPQAVSNIASKTNTDKVILTFLILSYSFQLIILLILLFRHYGHTGLRIFQITLPTMGDVRNMKLGVSLIGWGNSGKQIYFCISTG